MTETRDRAALARLLEKLDEQGLLCEDGTTIYGQPASHRIVPGHEPQDLMAGNSWQRQLVACAHAVPATADGLCASWVELVYSRLGFGLVTGDAADICRECCHYTDTADLKVGMAVATPAHPWGGDGAGYGHVGLYVGDSQVMDSVGGCVRTVPLELWLTAYGVMARPRWGWLAGIALDRL